MKKYIVPCPGCGKPVPIVCSEEGGDIVIKLHKKERVGVGG